ncbi:MAG TPA: chemotaxis protein CheW [Candidatus Kapabacteria bacterium]|jgi:purine-binding chemotaxis protein CheW|nr:chemotaxis protein CheW [Candidatus Kapabacteria bacterium]HPP40506.1 chemotaxis protein CheW [Candidatus Kapabacteria bacterium]HPU24486.1 chemotaxis protein CheW [Candidatus Kapabacteria bacterium]
MQTEDLYEVEDAGVELDTENTLEDRYLTFKTGDEQYAFEIEYVTEIIGIQNITPVPNIKPFIKGIINLRGIIYPVICVRKRFNIPEIPYNDRTCIIIVNVNNNGIGLIVDEVAEVIKILPEQISPPPQTNKGSHSKFIKGIGRVGENLKIILDIKKLLYDIDSDINEKE